MELWEQRKIAKQHALKLQGKVICACGAAMELKAYSINFLKPTLWWCDDCKVTAIVEPEHIKRRKRMRLGFSAANYALDEKFRKLFGKHAI
jgi:hypothetical protein